MRIKKVSEWDLNSVNNRYGLICLMLLSILSFSIPTSAQKAVYDISAGYKLDSLKGQLTISSSDSQRFEILTRIRVAYFENNTDSALHYSDRSLDFAKKNNYHIDEAHILIIKTILLTRRGLYSEALQLLLESKDKLENMERSEFTSSYLRSFYNNNEQVILRQLVLTFNEDVLGRLYAEVGNQEISVLLFKKSKQQYLKYNSIFTLMNLNYLLADYYLSINEMDSALILVNETRKLPKDFAGYWNGIGDDKEGQVYLKLLKYDSAKLAFQNALAISIQEKNFRHQISMYNRLAEVYLALDSNNLAQDYVTLAINNDKKEGQTNEIAKAYFIKSSIYQSTGVMDSAFHYLTLANTLADSLLQAKFHNVSRFNVALLESNLKNRNIEKERIIKNNQFQTSALIATLILFSLIGFVLYRSNHQKQKANLALEKSYSDLKSTQSQLIQSEKMASLGELTAGIAHEIQNPLNFVNNFSEVNSELSDELTEEAEKGNIDEIKIIAKDIKENSEKINHHGKRAGEIVKGMLQHSRVGSGKKEPTDINALCDEYLRLAFHGLRAKDKTFNASMHTDFDESIEKINVIPQDIGRVVLNLINNAFYAAHQQRTTTNQQLEPLVTVRTKNLGSQIEIQVEDNGNGIPDSIKEKIFQPFFTTKPTGQGTGLGLSLSYDIVKAHGGELKVETRERVVHLLFHCLNHS